MPFTAVGVDGVAQFNLQGDLGFAGFPQGIVRVAGDRPASLIVAGNVFLWQGQVVLVSAGGCGGGQSGSTGKPGAAGSPGGSGGGFPGSDFEILWADGDSDRKGMDADQFPDAGTKGAATTISARAIRDTAPQPCARRRWRFL